MIDCLASSEVDAMARAEELYADESIEAVRVMRGHFSGAGENFESQVMERVREGRRGAPPLRLAAAADEVAWCDTLADFYGPSSRFVMGRLLRNFLDRFQITPTELLHHHRFIKQLDNADSLLPGAVQRIAAIQGDARKVDRRTRADAIDKFVSEATTRARDALASRAAPRLGPEGLPALVKTVAERATDPAEQAFWLRHAVARAFEETTSFAAKFEMVMGWAAPGLPPNLMPLIDELTAGLMGSVSMIKDTLGNQANLGGALTALAGLASGKQSPNLPGAPPCFPTLAKLMAEAPMPETRTVLYDRLERELATDKPLSRDDTQAQRRQFESLLDSIAEPSGLFAGGPGMVQALAKRSRRFDIVGGVEDVRFPDPQPAARLTKLLEVEKTMFGQRQQQGIATYMRDAIGKLDADPGQLADFRAKISACGLPDPQKRVLLERMPLPGTRA